MSIFSPLEDGRPALKGLNERVIKSEIENFSYFNA